MQLNTEIVIDRPVAAAFARFADLERAPEWATPALVRRKLTEGPVGVGTRFHAVDQYPGRRVEFTVEVTAYERDRLMAASSAEPMDSGWEARFVETDGATRLTLKAYATPKGPLRLLAPVIVPWIQIQIQKDLETLKEHLEREAG